MSNSRRSLRILLTLSTVLVVASIVAPALAQEGGEHGAGAAPAGGTPPAVPWRLEYLGAGIGAGMVVIGAAMGIGRFAAAAAESVARQPQAAAQITGAVNLPLFLLEGVAIIGEVVCLLLALK